MSKIFHHSQKEHAKISEITKFGGDMLQNMENIENIVLRSSPVLYMLFCITHRRAYHMSDESGMLSPVRNTNTASYPGALCAFNTVIHIEVSY